MALQQKTLSNRSVAALELARDTVFWDWHLPGFGLQVRRSGRRVNRAYPVVTDTHQIWGRERLHTSRKHTTYGGCLC